MFRVRIWTDFARIFEEFLPTFVFLKVTTAHFFWPDFWATRNFGQICGQMPTFCPLLASKSGHRKSLKMAKKGRFWAVFGQKWPILVYF